MDRQGAAVGGHVRGSEECSILKTNGTPASPGGRLVKVHTAYGQLEASVLKAHLEAEGIPVLLQYDSASHVFAITVDGLGKVDLLVPEAMAGEARDIIGGEIKDSGTE